ncbi:MAG: hypothetical protein KDB03_02770 [Planctomycetales bacterium]|nr:hypothetical protein [Planctomycetales bacterium]
MDWIDPRYVTELQDEMRSDEENLVTTTAKGKDRGRSRKKAETPAWKPLANQVAAALAQPLEVWSTAFGNALSSLKWPLNCSLESTFLWSSVIQEQAEVLVRSGMSAKKLACIVSESSAPVGSPDHISDVVGLMGQPLETLAFTWLDGADSHAHCALGVAALAWHIPEHAERAGNIWLTQWLQASMDRSATYEPHSSEAILCQLVLRCELPLLIGFATQASKRILLAEASRAMDSLAEFLECSLEDPAPWLAYGATYLRASLACVLRCRVVANALGLRKWYPPQQKALAKLLEHALRFTRPGGSQLLCATGISPKADAIWLALIKQTRRPTALLAAMQHANVCKPVTKVGTKLPDLTYYSAEAAGACLQTSWKSKKPRIAIDFSDQDMCLEVLGPKGQPVLTGEWLIQVEQDGQAELQHDTWDSVCWFSDDDVDYLEVEAQFGQHARIQRQIILFREDRLLLLADALLADVVGDWRIRSEIPLAPRANFLSVEKMTEAKIQLSAKSSCLALPLFMPEWIRQGATGTFGAEDNCLVMTNSCSSANRLYMPTLISLHSKHSRQPYTWRKLTVGEDLRIVRADEAAAYRMQIGKDQWVIYRTLAPATRRTAIGMHTLCDFYAGRFDSDLGEVDTLVEVEPSDSSGHADE